MFAQAMEIAAFEQVNRKVITCAGVHVLLHGAPVLLHGAHVLLHAVMLLAYRILTPARVPIGDEDSTHFHTCLCAYR